MRYALLLLPLAALPAQAADFADLPAAAAVARALDGHPAVKAAAAGIGVEEAHRDGLVAGPHEFTLRLEGQRRREVPLDQNFHESAVGIERAIRLPGKGATDAALGEAGVRQARFALGDARHETSRLLLKTWFDWQREQAAAREWQAQADILRRQAEAAKKRVAAGDAARLEASLAAAQLEQAEAQWAQAQTRAKLAATDFAQQFPSLALPPEPRPAEPQPLPEPAEQWLEQMLAHNHELRLAGAASRRQQLVARRADAERLPDPTLGLRLARERDGQERLLGLQLAIPLPGGARAAASRAALAGADAAAAREAQAKAKVEAEARRTLTQAQAAYGQWRQLAAVAGRMADNAALLDRAWRLGEGQFGELQIARRQAIEARLAAVQAQLEANEARYRVLLDAHALWDLDGEEEGAADGP